jgi:hypothetical protein
MKKTLYLVFTLLITQLTVNAQWSSIADIGGQARDGVASFVINDVAYVGAGIFSSDFWKYDATNNTWTKLADIPSNKTFAASFSHSGKGYLVCGDLAFGQASDEVWEYDPATDAWTQKGNFPGGKRVGMFTFTIGNRVFVGGGTDVFSNTGYGTVFKDFYEYIPSADLWVKEDDLPSNIVFASAFTIGNKGYFCLGSTGTGQATKFLYEYDPDIKSWSTKADYPGTARDAGIGFAINGKGYAGMGQTSFTNNYSDMYAYNPANDTWTAIADYPNDRTAWGTAFVIGNAAYVGMGATVALDFSKSFYSLSPTTGVNEFTETILNVYPNPFTNTINLSLLPKNEEVKLTDVSGRLVATANTLKQAEINTENLATGVYFLHSSTGVAKLLKQ